MIQRKCLTGYIFQKRQPVATPLDLKNLGGVFFVLGVGTFFGIVCTFVELSVHTLKKTKLSNVSFKSKMMDELKFFFQFRRMRKPVADL